MTVRVVEGETHPEDDSFLDEALAGIGFQPFGIIVAAAVEQKRGDGFNVLSIQGSRTGIGAFCGMDDAHNDRCFPGPLEPALGLVDVAFVLADPTQSGRAGVALPDGVRGNETERASLPQQVERTAKEMSDEVGIAVAPGMKLLEPVGIAGSVCRGDRILASERRITEDRIETRVLALEHLRKLQLPMEGSDR